MNEAWQIWKTEAEMVRDFTAFARHEQWEVYAETGGWDLLLVRADGFQVGIEAKLALNAKVLCQVLERGDGYRKQGPDCYAVLVPKAKAVNGLEEIARHLGIVVVTGEAPEHYARRDWSGPQFKPLLPHQTRIHFPHDEWPERAPDQRHKLPAYVPDVTGGHSAPVQLTDWKIKALKVVALIEINGRITRDDFRAIGIDHRRWCQFWLKSDGIGGWVPNEMPDFKAQHPVNFAEIKADFEKWAPKKEALL